MHRLRPRRRRRRGAPRSVRRATTRHRLPPISAATRRAQAVSRATSFACPAPTLTNEERRSFEVGDSFFTQNWVTAPASTDARDGLGPTFNAQACSSCHVFDGRGAPPDRGADAELGLLLRLSRAGETPTGAPLPTRPTAASSRTARSSASRPRDASTSTTHDDPTAATATARRTAARPTYAHRRPGVRCRSRRRRADLAAPGAADHRHRAARGRPRGDDRRAADPDDADGDGISGRPNRCGTTRARRDRARPLRLEGQRGRRSSSRRRRLPRRHRHHVVAVPRRELPAGADRLRRGAPNGGDARRSTDERLDRVTFYARTLAVPAMRDADDDDGAATGASCSRRARLRGVPHADAARPATTRHRRRWPTRRSIRTPTCCCTTWAGSRRRPARLRATGTRVAHAAAVGHRARRRRQRRRGSCSTTAGPRTLEEAILWHGGEGRNAMETFRDADTRPSGGADRVPGGAMGGLRQPPCAALCSACAVDDSPSRSDVMGCRGERDRRACLSAC